MGGLDFTPAGYRVVTVDGGKLTSYHRTVVDAPRARDRPALRRRRARRRRPSSPPRRTTSAHASIAARRSRRPRAAAGSAARRCSRTRTGRARGRRTATSAAGMRATRGDAASRARRASREGGRRLAGARRRRRSSRRALRRARAAARRGVGRAGRRSGAASRAGDWRRARRRRRQRSRRRCDRRRDRARARDRHAALARRDAEAGPRRRGDRGGHGRRPDDRRRRARPRPRDGQTSVAHPARTDTAIAARATFGTPTPDGSDVAIGNQHELAIVDAATGTIRVAATIPCRTGIDTQIARGRRDRRRARGRHVRPRCRRRDRVGSRDRRPALAAVAAAVIAVNASPVIADGRVFVVERRRFGQRVRSCGQAVLAGGARSGGLRVGLRDGRHACDCAMACWSCRRCIAIWSRSTPRPARPCGGRAARRARCARRTTAGRTRPGFEASPVITGQLVWAADTAGQLVARDLHTGDERGRICARRAGARRARGQRRLAGRDDVRRDRPRARDRATAAGPPIAGCVDSSPEPARGLRVGGRAAFAALAIIVAGLAALWRRRRR